MPFFGEEDKKGTAAFCTWEWRRRKRGDSPGATGRGRVSGSLAKRGGDVYRANKTEGTRKERKKTKKLFLFFSHGGLSTRRGRGGGEGPFVARNLSPWLHFLLLFVMGKRGELEGQKNTNLRLVVDVADLLHHELEVVVPGQGFVDQVRICK